MSSRGTSEGGRASCVRGAARCAYLARMVEHDEARQDPHHEEAHIARLVACERRHGRGLGGVSHDRGALQWRGEGSRGFLAAVIYCKARNAVHKCYFRLAARPLQVSCVMVMRHRVMAALGYPNQSHDSTSPSALPHHLLCWARTDARSRGTSSRTSTGPRASSCAASASPHPPQKTRAPAP